MAKSSLSCQKGESKRRVRTAHPMSVTEINKCGHHLCNKLDDFNKDIERHVSGYHTARSFGEKRCYNSVEATVERIKKRLRFSLTNI